MADITDNQNTVPNSDLVDRTVAAVEATTDSITPLTQSQEDIDSRLDAFDEAELEDQSNMPQAVKDLGLEAQAPESEESLHARLDQFDATGVTAPESIGERAKEMHTARGIFSVADVDKRQKINSIARDLNMSRQQVEADLEVMSEEAIRSRAKIPDIARNLPVLAKWMARPDNYVLAENTGDWTTSLTKSAELLNPENDLKNMLTKSAYAHPIGAVHTLLLSAAITPEKAQTLINAIEDEQNGLPLSAEGQRQLQALAQASVDNEPRNLEFVKSLTDAWRIANIKEKHKEKIDFEGLYDKSVDSLDGVLDFLKSAYENPQGAKLMAAQVAATTGPSMAISILGGVTRQPLKGAALASSMTAMLSVGESMQEDLEEFRDPNTGRLDIVKAFSDPARVSRFRKRSSAYAGAMGVSEFLYSKYIGKGFSKILKTGGKAGVKEGAKVLAKDAIIGGIEEGGSQFTASMARDAIVGEVTEESTGKAITQAQTEAVAGLLMGGTVGAVRITVPTAKKAYYKIKAELGKATKAAEDMVDLHQAKVVAQQNEASKKNKDQVADLINETTQLPPLPDEHFIPDLPDEVILPALPTDENVMRQEEIAVSGSVQVSPSELIEFFESQNVDPDAVMQELPPKVYENYLRNKDNNVSIAIDMGDWMLAFEDFPEIEEIVRINGNEYNAREASEVTEDIQDKPFALFSEIYPPDIPQDINEDDDPTLPPLPETEAEIAAEESIIGTPFETSEVIRFDEIRSRFRSEDDAKAMNILKNRLLKGTSTAKNITPEMVEGFAEIQYAHLKNRASITGKDLMELVKEQKIQAGKSGRVYGSYTHFFQKFFFSQIADANTIVHEYGHSWLNEMTDDYVFMSHIPYERMTLSQKDYWYSMEVTAKLLKIPNVGVINTGMSKKERTRIHESFAQTTSQYFIKGDYGNSTVKSAMESFRKYMAEFIGFLKDYLSWVKDKGFIPLEITPEVNRLFDGIIGVDHNADEVLNPMFQNPMFDQDMLGGKFKEYFDTARDATNEAIGLFASRIMNSSYAEREKLINSTINKIDTRATAEIDTMPEMQVGRQMKANFDKYTADKKAGLDVSDPRISYKSFLELFKGDETAAAISRAAIPNYIIAPKKRLGVDSAVVMGALGLTNPEDLINTLMTIGRRDEMIDSRADKIIDEEFPVLKSDDEIRDQAVQSLSNMKMSKFLHMEMKILATKYLPTLKNLAQFMINSPEGQKTPKEAMKPEFIKYQASDRVTKSLADRFSSRLFYVDFGKSTREAGRAFKAGDFAMAFDSKVNAAIAYNAAKMAHTAQKKMLTAKTIAKRFLKYSAKNNYKHRFNPEIMIFGREFVQVVNSGEGNIPVLTMDMFPNYAGVTEFIVENINAMVADFVNRSNGNFGAGMTVGALIEFGETVKIIQRSAAEVKNIEEDGKKIPLVIARGETAIAMMKAPSVIHYADKNVWSMYKSEATLASTVLHGMYPSLEAFSASHVGKADAALETGQALSGLAKQEDHQRLFDNFKSMANASPKGSNLNQIMGPLVAHAPLIGPLWKYDANSKPITSETLDTTFKNVSEIITAELLMGSPSGAEKLLRGGTETHPYAFEENYIDGVIDIAKWQEFRQEMWDKGILTKAHYDAFQDIWNMFDEKHTPLKDTMRKTDGYLIGKVEGWDIHTPWGVYKGKYMPVAQDKNEIKVKDFNQLLDMDTQRLSGKDMYARQNTGMTNQRNDKFTPLSLDPNRIPLYMAAVNDIIHMREALINYGKIIASPEVQEALNIKRPGAFNNVIVPHFDRVRNQRRRESSVSMVNSVAKHLRKGTNVSIYLGNYMTPLKQPLGLIPALIHVDKKHLAQAGLVVMSNPQQAILDIEDQDPRMRNRFQSGLKKHVINDFDSIVNNFDWVASSSRGTQAATYFAISYMQARTDAIVWIGAKEQAVFDGLSPEEAINTAYLAVVTTQSSPEVSYTNNAQAQTAMSQFIQGIATSYSFTMWNLLHTEIARNPVKLENAKKIMGVLMLTILFPAIFDAAMGIADKIATGDEEEDKKNAEDRLAALAIRAASGVLDPLLPIVGRGVVSFAYGQKFSFVPMSAAIERESGSATSGLKRNAQGIDMTPREMKGLFKSLSIFLHVPAAVLANKLFIEKIWIEGLSGEDLDDRMRTRKRQVRRINRGNR